MNKKTIIAVVIIAILLVVGLIIAFQMNKKDKEPVNETNTNTSETAKTENSTTEEETNTNNKENQTEGEQNMEENTGKYNAVITVKDYGTIEVNLDENAAPITVENFVKLAKEGFYDGLTFHRIISGFMIQGGDPEGTGRGGSDETIKGEFKSNGVENPISHKRGVISMARSNDPDSASSQFFIMHDDGEYLDGNYAAFGHVTSGMDVVDKICENVQPEDPQSGSVAKDKQPVIESIKIEE